MIILYFLALTTCLVALLMLVLSGEARHTKTTPSLRRGNASIMPLIEKIMQMQRLSASGPTTDAKDDCPGVLCGGTWCPWCWCCGDDPTWVCCDPAYLHMCAPTTEDCWE